MARFLRAACVAAFLALVLTSTSALGWQSAATGTAAIRGRVLDQTGGPLSDADVSLVRFDQSPNPANRWTVRTGDAGEFSFTGLVAGRYRVIASRSGYAMRTYQSTGLFDVGRDLSLGDGESLDGLDIVLPRAGVIRGRIVDEAGQPVVGADVMPQARYEGKLVGVQQGSRTNATGDYELAGLAAGTYFVMVSASRLRGGMGRLPEDFRDYDRTWFPGVGDEARQHLSLSPRETSWPEST
jgi:hypothetical protein